MRLNTLRHRLRAARAVVPALPGHEIAGRVSGLSSQAAQVEGLSHLVHVGDLVALSRDSGEPIMGEVASVRSGIVHVVTFDPLDGVGAGHRVVRSTCGGRLPVTDDWCGRVVDPLGRPLDNKGALPAGPSGRPVHAPPPPAIRRARLGQRLELGVCALDLFTPCRQGQRLGLFAGSGIGKSTLLAMLARFSECDVVVLALVGERGREVREFLEDDLGPEGQARSVVVVATSDMPALMRRQAGYAAMAIAEHFRDQGLSVLLLMDSVTRFCHALREIALATGEFPATRGYPASVFAQLPRLLERAGPGPVGPDGRAGHITAFFTVLVDGDDHNEPIADSTRGILDGHLILDRKIAESGRYPPIDVLRSLSRATQGLRSPTEEELIRRARAILADHAAMVDMIRLGAYRPGTDPAVDTAIRLAPRIDAMLRQTKTARPRLEDSIATLAGIVGDVGP